MSARSVNKVILIGNLTRAPELRYTPQGTPVASFGVATNREWTVDGTKKEAADFHNIVAWNKLAELCSQLLAKGTKVYVEGRLQTRDWTDAEGVKKYKTEVVIEEMIILQQRSEGGSGAEMHTEVAGEGQTPEAKANPEAEAEAEGDIDLDEVLSEDFGTDEEE